MGIARGWEKQVIRTNHAKQTVGIFSVSCQSRSPFSVLLKNTDCFAVKANFSVVIFNSFKFVVTKVSVNFYRSTKLR